MPTRTWSVGRDHTVLVLDHQQPALRIGLEMDIRELTFDTHSFDIIIDKGGR